MVSPDDALVDIGCSDSPFLSRERSRESCEHARESENRSSFVHAQLLDTARHCVATRLWSVQVIILMVVLVVLGVAMNGEDIHGTSSLSFIGRSELPPEHIHAEVINSSCRAGSWVVGFFKTADECAHHVKAAGGKFFEFGSEGLPALTGKVTVFGKKPCVVKFTEAGRANGCPEGFVSSPGSSYYTVKGEPGAEFAYCRSDLIKLGFYQHDGKQDVFISNATGFVNKSRFADTTKPLVLLTGIRKDSVISSLGFKKKVCKAEYILECPARHAKIAIRESCCETFSWNPDCVPYDLDPLKGAVLAGGDKRYKWMGPLDRRGDYVDVCPTKSATIDHRLGEVLGRQIPQKACITAQLTSRTVTLGDQMQHCSIFSPSIAKAFADSHYISRLWNIFFPDIASSLSLHPEASDMNPFVFDAYTISMTAMTTFVSGMMKKTSIPFPSSQGFTERGVVFTHMGTPRYDIDQDKDFFSPAGQDSLYCAIDAFRMFVVEDSLDTPIGNQWTSLLLDRAHPDGTVAHLKVACPDMLPTCTMKQFVQGVYNGYKTGDGDPAWPKQVIDFDQYRRPDGSWHDDAEKFLAFGFIGSHRLEKTQDGYVLDSLALKGIAVRPGFEKLGAKMFFNANGDPTMIETHAGVLIRKSSASQEDWQYWKFCWRSSMVLYITLVDHLWLSHFVFANDLSAASREALPSGHPLRRLLSVFTYDSIKVNDLLTHQLLGPDQLLQRAMGAADYYEVRQVVLKELPQATDFLVNVFGIEKLTQLDATIMKTPFFSDSAWLYEAIERFIDQYVELFKDEWSDIEGFIKDKNILWFLERSRTWNPIAEHESKQHVDIGLRKSPDGPPHIDGFKKYLALRLFGVTGFHRHVSQVHDMLSIPDFVTFSWKEGETSGRPQQHMEAVLMFASTAGIISPNKMESDFSYIADGMSSHSAKAKAAFRALSESMADLKSKIDENNRGRDNPYLQMHPSYVDSSVSM